MLCVTQGVWDVHCETGRKIRYWCFRGGAAWLNVKAISVMNGSHHFQQIESDAPGG